MPSGHLQELFFHSPVFHNLGRKFHKVPGYGSAGQGRVFPLAQYAVESVAELVENGGHFPESQK